MKLRATSQDTCFITSVLCLILLYAVGAPLARADESSKAVKIAELLQLNSARQVLRSVDGNFDQEDAARAWGRFYADNLTESDLDAILAYYRSPVGQKDVGASRAALAQVQHYMVEKRRAGTAGAVAGNATAPTSGVAKNAAAAAGVPGPAAGNNTAASRGGVESPTAGARVSSRGGVESPTAGATAASHGGVESPTAGATVASRGGAESPTAGATASNTATSGMGSSGTVTPSAGTADAVAPGAVARAWDSNPLAPDGQVIANTLVPERCEAAPPPAPGVHAVPPSGRSVVCVCTDERGTLTRDPVIAESSGDSRVDSGALKMARADSGRYVPPMLGGRPQSACFQFAIDFRRHP